MTDIQADCATPERCVIGHPFNPPYLLPLVEIVGGKKTSPDAVAWAGRFYEIAGKAPLLMKKEIPGFVATRLQEALWREALHMVANGEATPEDIDIALMNGPAPRMVAQGQCMAFHVACGAGGMATNLDQFGPALKLPWTRLDGTRPDTGTARPDGRWLQRYRRGSTVRRHGRPAGSRNRRRSECVARCCARIRCPRVCVPSSTVCSGIPTGCRAMSARLRSGATPRGIQTGGGQRTCQRNRRNVTGC